MPAENFIRLLQAQTGLPGFGNAKHQWDAVAHLYKTNGIRGFFKGTGSALLKGIRIKNFKP